MFTNIVAHARLRWRCKLIANTLKVIKSSLEWSVKSLRKQADFARMDHSWNVRDFDTELTVTILFSCMHCSSQNCRVQALNAFLTTTVQSHVVVFQFSTCNLYSYNASIHFCYYRAACNADAVWRWEFCPSVRLSVRSSVRLSVKRVICGKMEERPVQIFTSYKRSAKICDSWTSRFQHSNVCVYLIHVGNMLLHYSSSPFNSWCTMHALTNAYCRFSF